MTKKFILATKNANKAREIRDILGPSYEILTQTEAGAGDIDVIEDGASFEENAAKKATAIAQATGLPAIADDSGLCVDALGGAPGIYSARYAGEHATDGENLEKLLHALKDVPPQERGAKFVCVMAVARPGCAVEFYRGECPGQITQVKKGENGFGYDPVFYIVQYGRTLAELPAEIKNAISHRACACRAMRDAWEKEL